MDIEFHYYITAYLAHAAGFSQPQAQILAYSSQLVNENNVSIPVQDRHSGKVYRNTISQAMNSLRPQKELMHIYPIFHFMPGEPDAYLARRKDGKQHILNTTPNSENANRLMEQALDSDRQIRLYWLGIAARMYVNTWSYQNFVGWADDFNCVLGNQERPIGFADCNFHPDWVSHCWYDSRLIEPLVNNRHRFLSAAKALFFWLAQAEECQHEEQAPVETLWPELEKELVNLMGVTYTGHRCQYRTLRLARYRQVMPWLEDFDARAWLDQAVETQVVGITDAHEGTRARFTAYEDRYYWCEEVDIEQTHWFAFQEAVKAHEQTGAQLLAPCFRKMGL